MYKRCSYQDITMTYGQVISQALAASGTAAVYSGQPVRTECLSGAVDRRGEGISGNPGNGRCL